LAASHRRGERSPQSSVVWLIVQHHRIVREHRLPSASAIKIRQLSIYFDVMINEL